MAARKRAAPASGRNAVVLAIAVASFLAGRNVAPAASAVAPCAGTPESVRAAVADLARSFPGRFTPDSASLARLDEIAARANAGDAETRDAAKGEFAALQRTILLANPLLREHPILYVSRAQYVRDHHNTETMFQTGELNTGSFRGGGALKVLDLSAGGPPRTLLESPEGMVRDPEVHFDGQRILFSMRRSIEDDYHLYEIGADGRNLRQLTGAPGVTDIDPVYLPDGDIVFSSSREPKYCMCNRHIMANLFRMQGDGANIHQIGKSTLFEGHGALMPDGRILYDRWEYVDRNFGDAQGLWTVYPDGTGHAVYWGNNTASPGAVLDPRPIPGTDRVLCTFSSCHDRPWGALAVIDRRRGLDGRSAVLQTWPAGAIDLVDRGGFDTFTSVQPKFEDPWPLDDKYFLCARMTGRAPEEMGIYLVDVFGNEVLVHAEAPGCFDPMPLGPRPRPAPLPARRDFANAKGSFYVADVYRGTHMQGVERGTVKWLRVVESPEKRTWTRPAWGGQGQEAPAMNWHDFSSKRILGTVPIEADGSAYFETPADTFVFFQLLDADGMMVQSMRSGTILQSAEVQGCTGCHEERRSTPPPLAERVPLALKRPASPLEGWYGPARGFSFVREVQPVFDRHCVRCHDYGKEPGRKLNLAPDRTLAFNTAYEELWRRGIVRCIGAGPAQTQLPRSWGSHASRIVQVLRAGHQNLKLDRESFERIVTWIDLNGPYYPTYSTAYPDTLAGRAPMENSALKRLEELTGVPLSRTADHGTKLAPQVSFDRPELSPCLAGIPDRNDPRFREAVALIAAGGAALRQRPRGDTEEGFAASDRDLEREAKYRARREVELNNRLALRNGGRVYDTGTAGASP